MPVRGAHHGDVGADAVETIEAVHRRPFDGRLAFLLQAELDEERNGSRQVVDDDADVVHALDRHAIEDSGRAGSFAIGVQR